MNISLTFVPALRGLISMCKSKPIADALNAALRVAEDVAAAERIVSAPHRISMKDLPGRGLPSNSAWMKGTVVADEIPGSDSLEVIAFYAPGSDRNILPELTMAGIDTILEELVNDWRKGVE